MNDFTARTLAECLFQLEAERIYNDPDGHFEMNDWLNKYGEDSVKFFDFETPEANIKKLASYMEIDYNNKALDTFEYSAEDYYDTYIGYIVRCFEIQLAFKTRVGYQLTILN